MEKQLFDLSSQQLNNIKPIDCMNINVGVLGHVDSGKTSICRILTQVASTASLDKSPQSKQRGITLDLGFSSFFTKIPQQLQDKIKCKYLQFTLVDCPGHASLIRTIIGGAQIIDIMLLVIDVNKGIQTQTAQCIIIAQMFINKLIIILNKIDTIQEKQIPKKIQALKKVFKKTKFSQNPLIIPYSTKQNVQSYHKNLKNILCQQLTPPTRSLTDKKFIMLVDHCFKIKGKGTILTGTIIQGKIKPGDQIQLCQLNQKSKIKSIQIFRKPTPTAHQGDRIALLMTHLQSQTIQRTIICTPGTLQKISKFILDLNKVRLYKRPLKNKIKFHIISGHQTVMGQLRLFVSKQQCINLDYQYQSINDYDQYLADKTQEPDHIFAIVTLQKQLWALQGTLIIGYKYDIQNDQKQCRLAFHGKIQHIITPQTPLKLFKDKIKKGTIDRIIDNYTLIIKDLFSKQTDLQQFIGKQITLSTGQIGKIDSTFGNSGKIRVIFKDMLQCLNIEGKEVTFQFKKWYH